jgi:hypothetical protein
MLLTRNAARPAIAYVSLPIAAAALAARLFAVEYLPPVVVQNLHTLLLVMLLLVCCATLELVDGVKRRTAAMAIVAIPLLAVAAAFVESRLGDYHLIGLRLPTMAEDGADYLRLCDYARTNTPVDAVFLVPPSEQAFRIAARRAIVVNFKGVPQLGSELPEWRDRLCRVLDLPDLSALPHGRFDKALAAIAERYDHLPAAHLAAVARAYGARYIVASRSLDDDPAAAAAAAGTLVFESGRYRLYDLGP